jgi:ubiquinone/menaquinone biosynthesis C-methylase UbiE
MRRVPTTELLDSDNGTPEEVAASLQDLRRINRWFGGTSTTRSMIQAVSRRRGKAEMSLLEVAAGSGYVPGQVREQLSSSGIQLQVTLLDRVAGHLGSSHGSPRLAADALALPFPDGSFDLVSSNLFAHHLSPGELVGFVRETLRVCREAVLINDLVRSPLHLAAVYAGFPLYRSRLTRHDAPASVRQAYTPGEMRAMLEESPAVRVEIRRHYLFRMGVIVWKKSSEGEGQPSV